MLKPSFEPFFGYSRKKLSIFVIASSILEEVCFKVDKEKIRAIHPNSELRQFFKYECEILLKKFCQLIEDRLEFSSEIPEEQYFSWVNQNMDYLVEYLYIKSGMKESFKMSKEEIFLLSQIEKIHMKGVVGFGQKKEVYSYI